MSAYPLPAPAGATVGQSGASALWNSGFPPAVKFLTNRPYAQLIQNTVQNFSPSGFNPVTFDGGFDNTGTAHNNTVNNSRYTCPLPGIYHVTGQIGFATKLTGSYPYVQVYLRRNGDLNQLWGPVFLRSDNVGGVGGNVQISAGVTMRLGDYVELVISSGSTTGVTTFNGYRAARMFVHWLST